MGRGNPQNFNNLADLVKLVFPAEQGLSRVHLDQDAAQAPHVNCQVIRYTEKNLWGPIETALDVMEHLWRTRRRDRCRTVFLFLYPDQGLVYKICDTWGLQDIAGHVTIVVGMATHCYLEACTSSNTHAIIVVHMCVMGGGGGGGGGGKGASSHTTSRYNGWNLGRHNQKLGHPFQTSTNKQERLSTMVIQGRGCLWALY